MTSVHQDYRSLRERGRSRVAAVRWLVRHYIAVHTPLRVTLVWYALRGRPIVHRVTFDNGTLLIGGHALVANCVLDMSAWSVEGPAIRLVP